jgi:alpha-amylase/alpha-mannosidase (GH57 family)
MHQPYYKDPLTGSYTLPWVRLHGIRSYYDMARLMMDFPEIRATVNLVPSLLLQILDYQQGGARDLFLSHTQKPAADLTEAERRFILRYFFMANWETTIKPLPRYYALLQDRGMWPDDETLDRALSRFKARDYLDLQVLFNLAWFGFKALEDWPSLAELKTKGRDYTEQDKAAVIQIQQAILQKLISLYKHLETAGQVELTTSPFYHPILPLLIDTNIARRSMPGAALPEPFTAPEDARVQVTEALSFHARLFGRKPRGMWPSEGSVCPELIPILNEAGVQWIATDEEVLTHSISLPSRAEGLYRPYRAEYEGRSVQLIFRDKELSNLLSFTYGRMDPQAAVADLMSRLAHIHEMTKGQKEPALAAVILDGENPWEAYAESGKPFLVELYTRLSQAPSIQTVKLGDHLAEHPPRSPIHKLHSGSWIHHDFDIWIGSHEENMAWEYLGRTRRALAPFLTDEQIPASRRKVALEAVYAAEGSDWFWWYGDDFASEHDEEFDRLFRAHLTQAFNVLGREAPEYLSRPIIHLHPVKHALEPVNFITPILDGKKTSYFEWQGAGYYNPMLRTTRYHPERLLAAIYYGFNLTHWFFRVDPHERCTPEIKSRLTLQINLFTGPGRKSGTSRSAGEAGPGAWVEYRIIIPCGRKGPLRFEVFRSQDGVTFEPLYESDEIALESVLELTVPFEKLGWKPNERFNFTLEVQEVDKILEIYPPNGYITFAVPDENFEQQMWSV